MRNDVHVSCIQYLVSCILYMYLVSHPYSTPSLLYPASCIPTIRCLMSKYPMSNMVIIKFYVADKSCRNAIIGAIFEIPHHEPSRKKSHHDKSRFKCYCQQSGVAR